MDLSSYVQDFERCGHAVLNGLVAPATLKMLYLYSVNYARSDGARSDELPERWRSLAGAYA